MILRDFADAGAGAFEEAGKVAAQLMLKPTGISAPNSGSSVSLLVNIMALAAKLADGIETEAAQVVDDFQRPENRWADVRRQNR